MVKYPQGKDRWCVVLCETKSHVATEAAHHGRFSAKIVSIGRIQSLLNVKT